MSKKQFELRFEGPKDNSANTLRQIKGVFVADLEFPISDVQRFIECAPVTVKESDSESELQTALNLLDKAGAKVFIVSSSIEKTNLPKDFGLDLELAPLELEFEQVMDQPSTELVKDQEVIPLELSFDFKTEDDDLKSGLDISNENTEAPEDSIQLEISESNSSSELKPETLKGLQEEPFSLELQEVETEPPPVINQTDPVNLDIREDTETEAAVSELELFTPAGSTLLGTTTEENNKEQNNKELETSEESLEKEPEKLAEIEPAIHSRLAVKPETTDHEQEIIEISLEQLKQLQKPAKARKKNYFSYIWMAIITTILIYTNSVFLSQDSVKNPFDALVATLPQISGEQDSQKRQQEFARKAAEISNSSWHTADKVFPDRSYKATVWVENNIPLHVRIELTTPKPPALTKEEIVNKVPERTWLKRIEIKDLLFRKENDKYVASGPALGYFYRDQRNLRVAGNATIEATVDSQTSNLTLKIQANNADKTGAITDQSAADIIKFGTSMQNASEIDYFFYKEEIFLKKP